MEISHLVLTPAYGRDYKSKKEVLAAWNEGKDFIAHFPLGTTYVNKTDVERQEELASVKWLEFRYKHMANIVTLTV